MSPAFYMQSFIYSHVAGHCPLHQFYCFFFELSLIPQSGIHYACCIYSIFFSNRGNTFEYVKCNSNSLQAYVFVTSPQEFNFIAVL